MFLAEVLPSFEMTVKQCHTIIILKYGRTRKKKKRFFKKNIVIGFYITFNSTCL